MSRDPYEDVLPAERFPFALFDPEDEFVGFVSTVVEGSTHVDVAVLPPGGPPPREVVIAVVEMARALGHAPAAHGAGCSLGWNLVRRSNIFAAHADRDGPPLRA